MQRIKRRRDPTPSRLEHDVYPYVITNSVRLTHCEVSGFQCGVVEDGARGDVVFKALSYKPAGCGFDSR